jgi:arylsulfatase A-like enzyme
MNHRHLPLNADTLANRMKGAGYKTGYIGKWHLVSAPNNADPGFDPDYRIFPIPEELRGGYDYWLASDTLEFTSHSYDGHMFDNDGKIYTSDQGSHFRTHNSEYKCACHEGCLRVPLIACGPGFQGGEVNRNLASLIDLPKTVLAAADADIPEGLAGNPAAGDAWPG